MEDIIRARRRKRPVLRPEEIRAATLGLKEERARKEAEERLKGKPFGTTVMVDDVAFIKDGRYGIITINVLNELKELRKAEKRKNL